MDRVLTPAEQIGGLRAAEADGWKMQIRLDYRANSYIPGAVPGPDRDTVEVSPKKMNQPIWIKDSLISVNFSKTLVSPTLKRDGSGNIISINGEPVKRHEDFYYSAKARSPEDQPNQARSYRESADGKTISVNIDFNPTTTLLADRNDENNDVTMKLPLSALVLPGQKEGSNSYNSVTVSNLVRVLRRPPTETYRDRLIYDNVSPSRVVNFKPPLNAFIDGAAAAENSFGQSSGSLSHRIQIIHQDYPSAWAMRGEGITVSDTVLMKDERVRWCVGFHEAAHEFVAKNDALRSGHLDEYHRALSAVSRSTFAALNESVFLETKFGGHAEDNSNELFASLSVSLCRNNWRDYVSKELSPEIRNNYMLALRAMQDDLSDTARRSAGKFAEDSWIMKTLKADIAFLDSLPKPKTVRN